jgi:hypothetical protein
MDATLIKRAIQRGQLKVESRRKANLSLTFARIMCIVYNLLRVRVDVGSDL